MSTKRTEPPSPSGPPRPNKMANTDAETAPLPPPAPVSHLLIKRLSEKAKLPTRGSALAAGYDLAEQKIIPARGKALVDTQISIAVPVGTYGRVAPRSGLASKFMIDTGAGVIDADYRGVVFVLLFNHSDKDFQVEEGDRVAQLIIEKIQTPEVMEVEDLEETLRGAGGFGSTGGHVSAKLAETLHLDQEFLDACADIAGEYESQPFFSPTGILVSPTAVSSGKASLLSDIAPKTPRLTGDYPYAYSDFYGSGTACVFKSGPPWPVRMGPEAYGIVREPRPVYGHPIGPTWLSVGRRICDELDSMAITWTCINPLAYADAGQARPFCPLILSIGVIPGSLHYDTAVVAAASIKNILAGHVFGTIDIEVAFVEWVVARSAGRKLLPFDPLFDRVPDLRKPFTSTLGLSIAPVKYPHYEGTAALYFRLSKDDNRVAVLTCAHVARPPPAYAANTAIMRKKSRQPREVFVALGHQAYANAIDAMTGATHNITSSIDKWNNALRRLGERIEGENSNTIEAREERQRLVAKALKDIEEVNKLHDEVTKFRTTPSQRVIGFLLHSEPIEVSVEPHGYTKDWALIELYDDKVDWSTFKGNKVYVGGELSVPDFRNTMFPHRTDRATYQYPEDGLLQAHGIVEDSEIRNPQHLDAYGNKCLPVVKNGSATGTTVGLVNGLESFTRSYSEYGISQTSVEFAVVASPKTRARFSDVGDSGSIVLARDGRIVGILTGGAGSPDETDVTYLTPYWWIEEQINAKYPGAFLHDVVQ